MKRFRKAAAFLLLAAMFVLAAGCGKKDTETAIDIDGLSKALSEKLMGDDILTEIDADYMAELYAIESANVAKFHVLLSSGATANEIAVFECVDKTAAEAVKTGVEARIQDQIDSYATYIPEEVPKLEAAKVYVKNQFVAVCVSSDADQADEIMKEYGF